MNYILAIALAFTPLIHWHRFGNIPPVGPQPVVHRFPHAEPVGPEYPHGGAQ